MKNKVMTVVAISMMGLCATAFAQEKSTNKPADRPGKVHMNTQPPAEITNTPEGKAMMQAATPGKFHEYMKALVGTWSCVMSEGNTTSNATMRVSSSLEGRYITTAYQGKMMGMDFSGIGQMGYNNQTGQYESTWMDTMSTGIMFSTGTCDSTGKVFTLIGTYTDPATNQKKKQKEVITVVNKDKHTMTFYDIASDGTETKTFEIVCTRLLNEGLKAEKPAKPNENKSGN